MGGDVTPIADIVVSKSICQPNTSLMESSQTQDSLRDAKPLSAENTAQSKLLRILYHFFTCINNANRFSINLGRLHDNFQTRKRVGDSNVNGSHSSTCKQSRCKVSNSVVRKFRLDIFLEFRLTRQTQQCRSQRMPYQRNCTTEKRDEIVFGTLAENFHDGFFSSSLFKVSALLFFNHSNGVDERSGEDGSAKGGGGRNCSIFS
mmetsp:Transcript_595/g.1234  ORF Transcript_595/g.1234 Transcript_595/m.1234 type:complete len:204 (+) Transcript_595:165-776(+)